MVNIHELIEINESKELDLLFGKKWLGAYYYPGHGYNPLPGRHVMVLNDWAFSRDGIEGIFSLMQVNINKPTTESRIVPLQSSYSQRLNELLEVALIDDEWRYTFRSVIKKHESIHFEHQRDYNAMERIQLLYDYYDRLKQSDREGFQRDIFRRALSLEAQTEAFALKSELSLLAHLKDERFNTISFLRSSQLFWLFQSFDVNSSSLLDDTCQVYNNGNINDTESTRMAGALGWLILATQNINLIDDISQGRVTRDQLREISLELLKSFVSNNKVHEVLASANIGPDRVLRNLP